MPTSSTTIRPTARFHGRRAKTGSLHRKRATRPSVPDVVRWAFAFGAGSVGYSYFYYPILTLVAQQELRVADFTIDKLFDSLSLAPKPRSYARRLKVLRDRGLLPDGEYQRWEKFRILRNHSTHPPWQQNWGHAMSLQLVKDIADAISELPWNGVLGTICVAPDYAANTLSKADSIESFPSITE
jgi:hypothetical protein